MRNWLSAAVGVGTLALLVGCSGSSSNMQVVDPSGKGPPGGVRQFISLGENLGYAFESEPMDYDAFIDTHLETLLRGLAP